MNKLAAFAHLAACASLAGCAASADSTTEPAGRVEANEIVAPAARSATTPASAARTAAAAPVIDSVRAEKAVVCEGEPNLITVKAHAVDGNDAFLHTVVGTRLGDRVPLRRWLPAEGRSDSLPGVKVFGKDGTYASAPLPAYSIVRCPAAPVATVKARLLANSSALYSIQAVVEEPGTSGHTFTPRAWRWRFDDGTTATTAVPHVVHSFEGRPQDRLHSTFLVEVEIAGDGHAPLVGRTSLDLLNATFEAEQVKGVVMLETGYPDQRFAARDESGDVVHRVRLYHHKSEAVRVNKVVRTTWFTDAMGKPHRGEIAPESILGAREVPADEGLNLELRIAGKDASRVYQVMYDLAGVTADGKPAVGKLTIMSPPPAPTREQSTPVTDPGLLARIRAARDLLGKAYVSEEEIAILEREGRFADLPPRATGRR
jgi:hypothetical protein